MRDEPPSRVLSLAGDTAPNTPGSAHAVSPHAPSVQRPARPTLRRIWRALRTPAPDERPSGVPKLVYHFPLRWIIAMGRDMALARPRSFRDDCALAVRVLPRAPVIEGLEHVPRHGSFILVANHYQRRDLWIGWAGALLCDALWRVQPALACHFITTDRAVLDGASIGWTRWLFHRVASVWDLVLLTPLEARDASADRTRRHVLRQCLRKLRRADGRPVCLVIFPEGMAGSSGGLAVASRGSGRSLLALAGSGTPLLPAAVWEDHTGALHARFGRPWHPAPPTHAQLVARDALDTWAGDDAMRRVAALLPESLRGHYRAASVPEVDA